MKRYACFKVIAAAVLTALLTAACVKHEEIEFSGTVRGVRNCAASMLDQNIGYMVELETPEGIGGTVTGSDGNEMHNIIVLYQPPKRIMVQDHIHGVFYRDDKFSKANCELHYNDLPLPEGVILEVSVD